MAQYIDKDALLAKINKRIIAAPINNIGHQRVWAYNDVKDIIDTLEVKDVGLDDFIKEEFNKYSCVDGYGQLSVSYNMAEFYGMIKRLTKAQKGE